MKISPTMVAFLVAMLGCALAIAGVYRLAGTGWALVAGAVPCLMFSLAVLAGMRHAG